MKFIIDSHTYIWYIDGNEKLSKKALSLIEDKQNEIFLSIASIWEISIKVQLGKLKLTNNFKGIADDLVKLEIDVLPINLNDILQNSELPFIHRDPFDRMIISQSLQRNIPIISCDIIFDEYSVQRIWLAE